MPAFIEPLSVFSPSDFPGCLSAERRVKVCPEEESLTEQNPLIGGKRRKRRVNSCSVFRLAVPVYYADVKKRFPLEYGGQQRI